MNDEELSYLWKISKIMLLSKYTFMTEILHVNPYRIAIFFTGKV